MVKRQKYLMLCISLLGFFKYTHAIEEGALDLSSSQSGQATFPVDSWENAKKEAFDQENQRVKKINSLSIGQRLKRVSLFRNSFNADQAKTVSLSELLFNRADDSSVKLNAYRKVKAEAIKSSAAEKSERLAKENEQQKQKQREKELKKAKKAKKEKISTLNNNELIDSFEKRDATKPASESDITFKDLQDHLKRQELIKVVTSLTNNDLDNMSLKDLQQVISEFDDAQATRIDRINQEFDNYYKTSRESDSYTGFLNEEKVYRGLLTAEIKDIQSDLERKIARGQI